MTVPPSGRAHENYLNSKRRRRTAKSEETRAKRSHRDRDDYTRCASKPSLDGRGEATS